MSQETSSKGEDGKKRRHIRIALAGNANVGKSVIFNQLTGLHQHIGNWPGKTVERAEGTLSYRGYTIDVLDLPGIYSLSTYSIEEVISRQYIAVEKPDVVVNVVDASVLERNLFFTIQLLEIAPRMVIALNQIDMAEKKGIKVNHEKLEKLLGVPVVPTIAPRNVGIEELVEKVIEVYEKDVRPLFTLKCGPEVEARIEKLSALLREIKSPYPPRWMAIKLLEGDEEVEKIVYSEKPELEQVVKALGAEIEEIHGHSVSSVIASERYNLANRIARECTEQLIRKRRGFIEKLEEATVHPVLGYVIMAVVVAALFYGVFRFGDFVTALLESFFDMVKVAYDGWFGTGFLATLIWDGIIEGLIAGITIALPYIIPFYIALSILEDSGYLPRIAFLMDAVMHKIGLHGKGFIPLILGFGCNVPAILGCRIMETDRERLICGFVASLIPCAATSVIVMGLVATYMGMNWAIALYILDFAIIVLLGRIAFKAAPGEPVGLIMEMPAYRRPTISVTASKTWFRLQDFIFTAFPIMIAGNFVIQISSLLGLLDVVEKVMSPVIVGWLGLPAATGITLTFGILRKELTLILLASLMGTTNFAAVMTPVQMFVYSTVVMVYIPCIATIAVLIKEFGYKRTLIITLVEIGSAILLGGVLYRILSLLF
ncbi:ferrous iron transport protein B [Candidatus Bathyarchaeota archaeon]|nr:ferrous iron transport protein B [Candidatus Bathyarchaeota archaeon]